MFKYINTEPCEMPFGYLSSLFFCSWGWSNAGAFGKLENAFLKKSYWNYLEWNIKGHDESAKLKYVIKKKTLSGTNGPPYVGLSFAKTHDNPPQWINLKTVWPLTRWSFPTAWASPWKTQSRHFGPAPCMPLPHSPHSASHHSLTTDQSPRPYVVMSCSLRVRGMGLLCPSAPGLWNIPALSHLHGCQADEKH